MKKILGVILLKSKSRRIKKKNFIKIKNKMMFQYILDESIKSSMFDKIHLSTESEKVRSMILRMKQNKFYTSIDASFLRPKYMAKDNFKMLDVLKYVISEFAKRGEIYSGICMMYATALLIKKRDITNFINYFNKLNKIKNNVSLQTVAQYPAPIEWSMSLTEKNILKKNKKKNYEKSSDSFDQKFYDTGGLHAITIKSLNSKKTQNYGFVMPKYQSIDIDYKEDLDFAKKLL